MCLLSQVKNNCIPQATHKIHLVNAKVNEILISHCTKRYTSPHKINVFVFSLSIANEIVIVFNNQPLTDNKKSLTSYGLKDGDLVALQHLSANASRRELTLNFNEDEIYMRKKIPAQQSSGARAGGFGNLDFSGISVPQPSTRSPTSAAGGMRQDPAMIRDMLLANPDQLAQLTQNNPELAESVLSGSLGKFFFSYQIYS